MPLFIQLTLKVSENVIMNYFNPFTPKSAKLKTEEKLLNFILQNSKKQTVSQESTTQ